MKWSSNLGFIFSTIGAAVGLGSLWRFPYTVGVNGGASFILLFLLLTLLVAFPLFLAEMTLGMMARRNAATGIKKIASSYGASKKWAGFGYLGNVTLILILSFYSIVSSWCIIYLIYSLTGAYNSLTPGESNALWQQTLSEPYLILLAHSAFIFLNVQIVKCDIQKGIERYSLILMPALFFILLALILYNAKIFGLEEAARFLFIPDFSKINGQVILSALGQAFFSLAVGAGCICMYASYQKTTANLIKQAATIALSNIAVSLIAGLAIFPIVFSHNMPPDAGTNLIFKTLPLILGNIEFGNFIGTLLFSLFLFAALTSSISLLEPPASLLAESRFFNKNKATYFIGFIAWALGSIYIFKNAFFDPIISLSTDLMLPLGALGFSLFVGWVIPGKEVKKYIRSSLFYYLIKWISPLGVTIILLSQLI